MGISLLDMSIFRTSTQKQFNWVWIPKCRAQILHKNLIVFFRDKDHNSALNPALYNPSSLFYQ